LHIMTKKNLLMLFFLSCSLTVNAALPKFLKSLSVSEAPKRNTKDSSIEIFQKIKLINKEKRKHKHKISELFAQQECLLDAKKPVAPLEKKWVSPFFCSGGRPRKFSEDTQPEIKENSTEKLKEQAAADESEILETLVSESLENVVFPETSTRFFMIWNAGVYGMFRTPVLGGRSEVQKKYIKKVGEYLKLFEAMQKDKASKSRFLIELFLDKQTHSHVRGALASLTDSFPETFKISFIEDFFNQLLEKKTLSPQKCLESSDIRTQFQDVRANHESLSIDFTDSENAVLKKIFSNVLYGNPALLSDALRVLALSNTHFDQNFYSDIDSFVHQNSYGFSRFEKSLESFREYEKGADTLLFIGSEEQRSNDVLGCFKMRDNRGTVQKMLQYAQKHLKDENPDETDPLVFNYYQDRIRKIKYDYSSEEAKVELKKTISDLVSNVKKSQENIEKKFDSLPYEYSYRAMDTLGPNLMYMFTAQNVAKHCRDYVAAPSDQVWIPGQKWVSYERTMLKVENRYREFEEKVSTLYSEWIIPLIENSTLGIPDLPKEEFIEMLRAQRLLDYMMMSPDAPQRDQRRLFTWLKGTQEFNDLEADYFDSLIIFRFSFRDHFKNDPRTQKIIAQFEKLKTAEKARELFTLLDEWNAFFLTKDAFFLQELSTEIVAKYKNSFFFFEENEDTKSLYSASKTLQNQVLSSYFFSQLPKPAQKSWFSLYRHLLNLEILNQNPEAEEDKKKGLICTIQEKHKKECDIIKSNDHQKQINQPEMLKWLRSCQQAQLKTLNIFN
jgi:hypothetical protein